MDDLIIKLVKVNKTYHDSEDTQVLFDIDMSITKNSLNAIIGQSGSGKTTLLNIIGTLDKPTTGEVYINGIRTDRMKKNDLAHLRNQTIGFIFQFHYLLSEFSVLENVLMPSSMSRRVSAKETQKAKELLDLVGLSERMHYQANRISGGQRQRTAIARALMNEPALILADEPTGNLDSKTTETVYDLFCKINRELKTTFVIITHNEEIAQKTDRIIEIKDGRITKDAVNLNNNHCNEKIN